MPTRKMRSCFFGGLFKSVLCMLLLQVYLDFVHEKAELMPFKEIRIFFSEGSMVPKLDNDEPRMVV